MAAASAKQQFHHTNGDMYVAIGYYIHGKELLDIAAIPLKNDFLVSQSFAPFATKIAPRRPIRGHADYITYGQEHYLTGELFDAWFVDLKMPFRKRIIPVTYNWAIARPVVHEWLGETLFNQCFSLFYRDLYTGGQYLNDVMAMKGEQPPFRDRMGLRRFVSALGIEVPQQNILSVSKSAQERALLIAECYRKMVQLGAL